jgi:hypothetical protein
MRESYEDLQARRDLIASGPGATTGHVGLSGDAADRQVKRRSLRPLSLDACWGHGGAVAALRDQRQSR